MALAAALPAGEVRECARPLPQAPQPAARFYRPELDLLRLLAFLMVWTAHASLSFAGLLPHRVLQVVEGSGSCGVPVFFFLSAFLITELLRREQCLTGTVDLPSFYVRRILRIWPLYLGVLAAYGLLGLRFHGFRIEPGRLLASLLLAGNWYIVLHPGITTPMRALWSISVEEQWYLAWPVLGRMLSRRGTLWLCAAIVAAAHGLLVCLAYAPGASWLNITAWDNSGVQFQYFALGAAAAVLLDGRTPRFSLAGRVALLLGAGVSLLLAAGLSRFKEPAITHSAASLVCGYGLAGLGTVFLFCALFGLRGDRCPRLLVRLGQLSFGLYVFHETGFFLANALTRLLGVLPTLGSVVLEKILALALTVGLAFASYYAWELPFLRLKQRWTIVRTREAR